MSRRGVTLIEMLVTVALLVLMMTIIVQIFQAATAAVSAQRVYQELDSGLRQLDSMIRTDLLGVTCKLTPPNDPKLKNGYLEYGENAFADSQLEDTDDYIRFTTKAPEGQFFTGRMYAQYLGSTPPTAAQTTSYLSSQPITITSQYAEVIYFLRNHNLYRRVFLVAPERQRAVAQLFSNPSTPFNSLAGGIKSVPALGGIAASWQGLNDLSAHPSPTSPFSGAGPILNTLADLTNRENRAFSPRYINDFVTNATGTVPADGIPDDENPADPTAMTPIPAGDGLYDYPRTLYPNAIGQNTAEITYSSANPPFIADTAPRVPASTGSAFSPLETMPFPYIYPGAYSQPDPNAIATPGGLGWIHSLDPNNLTGNPLSAVGSYNHAPLDQGDNLLLPTMPAGGQSWWGFPTWRESMSINWTDPIWPFTRSAPLAQADGLHPFNPSSNPVTQSANAPYSQNFLPPVAAQPFNFQLYDDGAGSGFFSSSLAAAAPQNLIINPAIWDDDLILTGVRSFDVKAYDNLYAGYVDLGWGDDTRLSGNTTNYLTGNPVTTTWNTQTVLTLTTFAHEGRIPPLVNDGRLDSQFGTNTIGDNSTSTIRLRRVWDTWSTDYSQVPARGYDPNPAGHLPIGPPFSPPVFPSYPPPYPQALRGIQIQIRVVDPRNERTKQLTIRHDFSDKL